MVLESLRAVLDSDYRGPRAVFGEVHVLKALIAIGGAGNIGRGRLGVLTGLGQGEVRTLIRRLKDNRLVTVEANGCRLSKKGEREYQRISQMLVWSSSVPAKSLRIGKECWAIIVRGAAKRIRYGIEQRDAAIKAGSLGAFTAEYESGRFIVPGEGRDCEKDGPTEPWTTIRKALPEEGDVMIVTGADNSTYAEDGALAAFLTLM